MTYPLAKLLVIETSPRGEASISRQLTRRFAADWQASHPQGNVVVRDLADTQLPHVNAPWLAAYFTPEDKVTTDMKEALRSSDTLVVELLAADHIVIASPYTTTTFPLRSRHGSTTSCAKDTRSVSMAKGWSRARRRRS